MLDVPEDVLEAAGAEYSEEADEHGRKLASTLVAGAVAEEDDGSIALDSPSRVGRKEDFSPGMRRRLRAEEVYGFRDGNLDDVAFSKDEVEIHRPRRATS